MQWLKKYKWRVLLPILLAAVLAFAFWYGGGAPGLRGWNAAEPIQNGAAGNTQGLEEADSSSESDTPTADSEVSGETTQPAKNENAEKPTDGIESRPGGTKGDMSGEEKLAAAEALPGGASVGTEQGDKGYSANAGMTIDPATGKDQYQTEPVPEGKPVPVEPQDVTITDTAYTCTISISCAAIHDNLDWLNPEKAELIPEDGWILEPTTVTFYEGESVFHVLLRTCKQKKIHMEYENTPIYNSAYIEAIQNIYEFDCGELSGWKYQVNDWFPNYGCSRYALQQDDVIAWVYTCNLGIDVGG